MRNVTAFLRAHPSVTAWLALSLGMVIILLLTVRGMGLTPLQTLWAALATVALAGGCVWLVDRAD